MSCSNRFLSFVCACLLAGAFALTSQCASAQPPKQLEVLLPNARLIGLPVNWNENEAILLTDSGAMEQLATPSVLSHRVLPQDFAPQSLAHARIQLQSELGERYETAVTGPYVLAAPTGQLDRWRERFNALLSGYLRYFEVRGWPLRQPDFPLCVVVYSTRQQFIEFAQRSGSSLPNNAVGSYFPKSNRCVLYQIAGYTSDGPSSVDWAETEATIVHEAVHQLAFNTGIHERLAENPLWFVEGLASMFEQANVYDLRSHTSTVASRMIPEKVGRLQRSLGSTAQLQSRLENLIVCDDLFRTDPILAYDLSWALTFYLAERRPNDFRNYYAALRNRPFGAYSPGARSDDFRKAFDGDLGLLAVQIQRLVSSQGAPGK